MSDDFRRNRAHGLLILLASVVAVGLLVQPLIAMGQANGTPASEIAPPPPPTQAPPPPPTEAPPPPPPPTEVPPLPPTEAPPPPPTEAPPPPPPPTEVPPTSVPPTDVPPAEIPPTEVPPTAVPSPTVTPTSVPPTAEPTAIVPNTDSLRLRGDVTSFSLEPGEAQKILVDYSVTTSRSSTTIHAQLNNAGEGWSLSSPDFVDTNPSSLSATWKETATGDRGSSFVVPIVITAPANVVADETVSLVVWSEATAASGTETGVARTEIPIARFTAVAPIVNTDAVKAADSSELRVIPGADVTVSLTYEVTTPRQETTIHAALDDGTGEKPAGWTLGPATSVTNATALTPDSTFTASFTVTAPEQVKASHTVSLMVWSEASTDRGLEEGVTRQAIATVWVAATPEAPISFEPEVKCTATDAVGSGQKAWSVQECTATWKTKNVSSVELVASTDDAAWRVASAPAGKASEAAFGTSDGRLTLADSDPDVDGFYTARFALGTQMTACSTAESIDVSLKLSAVSRAPVPVDKAGKDLVKLSTQPEIRETAKRTQRLGVTMPEAPDVQIRSASFTPVGMPGTSRISTGTIRIGYKDAPVGCNWQLRMTLTDFVDANARQTIPMSGVSVDEVTGALVKHYESQGDGTFLVTIAGSMETSGTLIIKTQLTLPGFTPPGSYSTTIKAAALLP